MFITSYQSSVCRPCLFKKNCEYYCRRKIERRFIPSVLMKGHFETEDWMPRPAF